MPPRRWPARAASRARPARSRASRNRSTHGCQLLACSHSPWMKTTGRAHWSWCLPDEMRGLTARAASTQHRARPCRPRSSDGRSITRRSSTGYRESSRPTGLRSARGGTWTSICVWCATSSRSPTSCTSGGRPRGLLHQPTGAVQADPPAGGPPRRAAARTGQPSRVAHRPRRAVPRRRAPAAHARRADAAPARPDAVRIAHIHELAHQPSRRRRLHRGDARRTAGRARCSTARASSRPCSTTDSTSRCCGSRAAMVTAHPTGWSHTLLRLEPLRLIGRLGDAARPTASLYERPLEVFADAPGSGPVQHPRRLPEGLGGAHRHQHALARQPRRFSHCVTNLLRAEGSAFLLEFDSYAARYAGRGCRCTSRRSCSRTTPGRWPGATSCPSPTICRGSSTSRWDRQELGLVGR